MNFGHSGMMSAEESEKLRQAVNEAMKKKDFKEEISKPDLKPKENKMADNAGYMDIIDRIIPVTPEDIKNAPKTRKK